MNHNFIIGNVERVQTFNRALTAGEVASIYKNGLRLKTRLRAAYDAALNWLVGRWGE